MISPRYHSNPDFGIAKNCGSSIKKLAAHPGKNRVLSLASTNENAWNDME